MGAPGGDAVGARDADAEVGGGEGLAVAGHDEHARPGGLQRAHGVAEGLAPGHRAVGDAAAGALAVAEHEGQPGPARGGGERLGGGGRLGQHADDGGEPVVAAQAQDVGGAVGAQGLARLDGPRVVAAGDVVEAGEQPVLAVRAQPARRGGVLGVEQLVHARHELVEGVGGAVGARQGEQVAEHEHAGGQGLGVEDDGVEAVHAAQRARLDHDGAAAGEHAAERGGEALAAEAPGLRQRRERDAGALAQGGRDRGRPREPGEGRGADHVAVALDRTEGQRDGAGLGEGVVGGGRRALGAGEQPRLGGLPGLLPRAGLGDLHRPVGGVDQQTGVTLAERLRGGVGQREQDVGALLAHRALDGLAQAGLVVHEGGRGGELGGQRGAPQDAAEGGDAQAGDVGGQDRERLLRGVHQRRGRDGDRVPALALLEDLDEVDQVVDGLVVGQTDGALTLVEEADDDRTERGVHRRPRHLRVRRERLLDRARQLLPRLAHDGGHTDLHATGSAPHAATAVAERVDAVEHAAGDPERVDHAGQQAAGRTGRGKGSHEGG